jgi:hypothetical protein
MPINVPARAINAIKPPPSVLPDIAPPIPPAKGIPIKKITFLATLEDLRETATQSPTKAPASFTASARTAELLVAQWHTRSEISGASGMPGLFGLMTISALPFGRRLATTASYCAILCPVISISYQSAIFVDYFIGSSTYAVVCLPRRLAPILDRELELIA